MRPKFRLSSFQGDNPSSYGDEDGGGGGTPSFFNPYPITNRAGKSNTVTIGDSFTVATGIASPNVNGWAALYNTYLGNTRLGFQTNGWSLWNMSNAGISFPFGTGIITLMGGFNDDLFNGILSPTRSKTLKKVVGLVGGIVGRCFSNGLVFSGSAGVVRSGGAITAFNFTSLGGQGVAGAIPGGSTSTSSIVIGATWSWTASFTSFAVQLSGTDGVAFDWGSCDIFVDGVLQESFVANGWYDAIAGTSGYAMTRGPVGRVFHGFAAGSHTVTIVNTSVKGMAVDWFSPLINVASANVPAFMWADVPHCLYVNPPYNGCTAASQDEMNDAILNQVIYPLRLAFPTKVGRMYSNQFYTLNNVQGDLLHPTAAGHAQLGQAAVNCCP